MSAVATPSAAYQAITEGCGLLDRSERGKLAISGSQAKAFLQGQLTNEIEQLEPGEGCYAAFLTQKGKMLGDVRVLDTGEELLLDTERCALQALFNVIRRFSVGYDTELDKRTLQSGMVSLIGPRAAALAGAGELPEAEHSHLPLPVDTVPVRAVRTDVGVDLICEAARTAELIELLAERGATAIGESTAECLRVERGTPRYGIDLDDTVIPQEAGLNERAVSFTKGCYVGQETVARLFYRGKPSRRLAGLRCDAPVAHGEEVGFRGKIVATVRSSVVSPRFGPIALALVRREAPAGAAVTIGPAGTQAMVVELPFA